MVAAPSGKFLFVARGGSLAGVGALAINDSTGMLATGTTAAGLSLNFPSGPQLLVDPSASVPSRREGLFSEHGIWRQHRDPTTGLTAIPDPAFT